MSKTRKTTANTVKELEALAFDIQTKDSTATEALHSLNLKSYLLKMFVEKSNHINKKP